MSGLFFKISQEVYATLITFICKNVFMSSFWGLFLANYKNPSLQYACETTVSEKAKYANKYFQGEKQALAGGVFRTRAHWRIYTEAFSTYGL